MDKYTADNTVIAAAENAVVQGETVFTRELCGVYATWRQRRLFEASMLRAQGVSGAAELVQKFKFESYGEA